MVSVRDYTIKMLIGVISNGIINVLRTYQSEHYKYQDSYNGHVLLHGEEEGRGTEEETYLQLIGWDSQNTNRKWTADKNTDKNS